MPSPNTKQLTLFNALHKSRTEDFKIFNKSSYRAVWSSIVDKYPETAHFIYELLQNADDAEATKVHIVLRDSVLLFKHNGRKHFDISEENADIVGDINSITGIGDSTKSNNQNKIGKFGVGFKAVFQYTDSPEIYDDTFKFRIDNYIIPTLIEKDHPERKKGETLFVFNLNKNTQKSYCDIQERLEGLHNPILFLRNLESISWQIEKAGKLLKKGTYKKKTLETLHITDHISLEKIRLYDNDQASSIFLFSEDIIVHVDNSEHKICIGFYYDEEKKRLVTQNRQNMYCFFPTKEALDTCFIVHAPFLLTDNRQNLKPNEELNTSLINLLADLSAKSILYLRDYGIKNKHLLIDKNIVDIIPEVKKSYWGSVLQPLVEPFHDAITKIISNEDVLLSRNNNYLSCYSAFIAEPSEIVKIVSKKDLFVLRDYDEEYDDDRLDIDFLKKDLAMAIQNSDHECFADIDTYTIDDFLDDLDSDFLETKNLEWVVKLYAFLKKNIRLSHWKPNLTLSMFDNTSRRLYKAPIIHTKSNEWVSFLNKDSLPQVFFAPKNSRGLKYSFVDKEYVKIEEAKDFLEFLGVKEPDEKDFIYSQILPKYEGESILGDDEELVADFERLLSYYSKIKTSGDDLSFVQILKDKFYIKNDEDKNFDLAKNLYFKSDFLDDYFNCNYSWVDYEYYQPVIDKFGLDIVNSFLKELGVKSGPQIINTTRITDLYLNKGALECLKNISTSSLQAPDHYLESFYRACYDKHITLNASLYLWDKVLYPIIINHADYMDSWIKFKGYRQRSWRTLKAPSTLSYEFQNLSWLYTVDNKIVSPKDISLEMLHPSYSRHQEILSFLGIEKKEKSIIELGGTEKQEEQRNLGEQLEHLARSKGMSVDELLQTLENIPNKSTEFVDVNSRTTNEDTKKPEKNEANKERQDFKTRLEKKWEEKENTGIHHPHTAPSKDSEFDVQVNNVNPQIEEQPLFSDRPDETSFDSGHKSNSKSTESELKKKNTEATEQAEQAKEQLEIYDWFNQTPKFTFLWFKLLMELMHVDKGKQAPRQVEVDFSEWDFTCSDKVLHLENPNRPVPSWATEATFAISAIGETSHKLKGIIAKSDQKSLDIALDTDDNYEKYCADAKIIRVILENDTNFIDSLDRRFIQLGFENDYDMNENLPKNIEFIYGPPGTGKTTKLVKRLHNIVKNRDKVNVLVLTPTNKAADVIAEKMVDDDECYGCLTRFGATESLYLIEDAAVVTNRTDTDITLLDKNILVTTAARYAYDYLQPDDTFICDIDWDLIVIDEASMIDLLTITYVLHKGKKSEFIISGDPKQIPPVVPNNLPAYNIYDMVGLNDFSVAINEYKRYMVTALKTQYRSVPVIGNAVSKFAYNGLLSNWDKRIAPKDLQLDGIEISHFNFIGFDTAEFDPILELGAIGKSAFHLYSVIFTYNMVKYTAKQIYAKYPNVDYTIGVVCPYKAQASAISQMLESNPIDTPNCHVSCGTVHGFQGDECDIMFVVMNPPANCSSESHVNEEYIINVGISRARDYLFILLPKGQPNGFYRKQQLGTLVSNNDRSLLDCAQIEEAIFGQKNYIYSNTHVTCHMPVNVYCEENAEYEVKLGDEAIDIKIRKDIGQE